MQVTVYTKPHCPKCNSTKRQLTKYNIPFHAIDMTTNDKAMLRVKKMGHMSAPVVEVGDPDRPVEEVDIEKDTWSDFRMDRIKRLAEGEEC